MFCTECNLYSKCFQGGVCAPCFPEFVSREWGPRGSSICVFEGCDSPPVVKKLGLCTRHRRLFWELGGASPKNGKWTTPEGTRSRCSASECNFVVESRGLCVHHYQNNHYEGGRGRLKQTKYKKKVNYDGTPVLCSFEKCSKPVFNHPWCAGHYYQLLRGEDLSELNAKTTCAVPRCGKPVSVKLNTNQICSSHRGLMTRFSLSVEVLFELFGEGRRKCENPGCRSTKNLHLDHDHSCCPYRKNGVRSCGNCVRGWLCQSCNVSLGALQENPRRIQGLLDYLDR